MGAVIDLDEFSHGDLGVDLGGGKAGVAEELLDIAEVGSAREQVCSEGMAKRVGRNIMDIGTLGDVFIDHAADAAGGEAASAAM